MSDPTNTSSTPADAPDAADAADEQVPTPAGTGGDDGGAALDRTQEAIDEAEEARGRVAARDDITARDTEMAGEYSETPEGQGGAPLT